MALFQSPLCSSITASDADPESQLNRSLQMQEMAHYRHQLEAPVGRQSSTCTQVIWIFFWIFVLLLLAYPVALLAALLYALLNPLKLLVCCRPQLDFLLMALNLPHTCTRNIIEAKQLIIM